MHPLEIIEKYYPRNSRAHEVLVTHSKMVMNLAVKIAKKHPEFNVDHAFIKEAAMLHDIGIIYTHSPSIGCNGDFPYICHGFLGSDLLLKEGLPLHARVCERHTGTGLTIAEIKEQNLPLPHRDMMPESLEEQIICFADKFYSKGELTRQLTPNQIKKGLEKYGQKKIKQFDLWLEKFSF